MTTPIEELSRRELEVLRWMACAKTNNEIALILGIATGTVRKHAENVYRKLRVSGRVSAVLEAQARGLV